MELQVIYLLIEAIETYFTVYLRAFSFTMYYPKYLTVLLNLGVIVSLFCHPENKCAEYLPFLGEFIVGLVYTSY